MPYKDPARQAEYFRTYKPRWKALNPERNAWTSKCYDAAQHANARAVRYGVSGVLTPADVAAVLATRTCSYCGKSDLSGRDLTVDHVKPLSEGGTNDPSNITCACFSCNARKWLLTAPRSRWAREHDRCVDCGTTEREHRTKGLCTRCYSRLRSRLRPRKGAAAA